MNNGHRSLVQLWTALLAGALLVSGQPRLWAQYCPSITLSITKTTPTGNLDAANQNAGLDGQVEVFFQPQGVPDGTQGSITYALKVYSPDNLQVYESDATAGSYGTQGVMYFDWLTPSMHRPWPTGPSQPAAGDFQLEVDAVWTPRGGQPCATYSSPRVTRTLGNPLTAEALPSDKLNTVCGANHPHIPTGSETDPQDGGQSWSIPVTS